MRYRFGAGAADWALTLVDINETPSIVQAAGGAVITCWSDELGDSQYEDLINADGDPVTSVTTSLGNDGRPRGSIPLFYGPDGVRIMWLSANGGPRMLVVGVEDSDGGSGGPLVAPALEVAGDATVDGDLTVAGALTVNALNLADTRYSTFSRTVVAASPSTGVWPVWRASKSCWVTAVHAFRVGGSGATVNAQVGETSVLAVDLSTSVADVWTTETLESPLLVSEGDTVSVQVVSLSGSPSLVSVQLDMVV